MKEFDQNKYIQQYNKEHYSAFKVDLLKSEKVEIDNILNLKNISKANFLRKAIEEIKKPEARIYIYKNKITISYNKDENIEESTYQIKENLIPVQIVFEFERLESLGYKLHFFYN